MFNVRRATVSTCAVIVLACLCWSQDKMVVSGTPLTEEQLSVYRGFLNKFSFLHFKNLAKLTVPLDFKGFPEGRPCLHGIELGNLSDSLRTTRALGPQITQGTDLKLVDPEREASPDDRKEKNVQSTNSESDYLVLSEIAFDTKHQFAVLKYLLVCGQHCVSGATLVMEKMDGTWAVSPRRPCALFVGN